MSKDQEFWVGLLIGAVLVGLLLVGAWSWGWVCACGRAMAF